MEFSQFSQVCAAFPQPPPSGRCQPAAGPLPLPAERLRGRAARGVAGAGGEVTKNGEPIYSLW